MKKCSKCGMVKNESEFHKDKRLKSGLAAQCKSCVNQYHKDNKEKLTTARKKYLEENAEAIKEQTKKYYIGNIERLREYAREYYSRNAERRREYSREYRKKHPEKIRDTNRNAKLKKSYGITLAEYDEILSKQGGVCAICKLPPSGTGKNRGRLHVDHDHESGNVRGLLCGNCNSALGHAGDSVTILQRLINYITAHHSHHQ